MEEMINNRNIRKEVEKKAELLAQEQKLREMQSSKNDDSDEEEEDETIGPSVEFRDQENPDEVKFIHYLLPNLPILNNNLRT